jgi:hypothetical protein
MHRLFRSIEEYNEIPQTFEGELPSDIFGMNRLPRLKIGEMYTVPGPEGREIDAELLQAVVANGKANAILRDPKSGTQWIGTFEMTAEELSDYARHPDTYFGVHQRQVRISKTPMDLFDFFVESYQETPREKLLEILISDSGQGDLLHLSQKELVEIVAERYTESAVASSGLPRTREEFRGKRLNEIHERKRNAEMQAYQPEGGSSSTGAPCWGPLLLSDPSRIRR